MKRQIPEAVKRKLADPKVNVIIDTFKGRTNWWKLTKFFPVFTVYYNPKEFPRKYVVRLFDGKFPTRLLTVSPTLEKARATVPPLFYCVSRRETDDPAIVETWL